MLLLLPILDFQIFFGLFSRTGSLCTNLFTAFIIMCFLSSIFMRPKKYHNAMKLQHDPLVTLHKTWYTFTHIAQSQTYKHHLGKFSFLCKLSSQIIFTIKALNQISGYLFARIVYFVWCQWIVGSSKGYRKDIRSTRNIKRQKCKLIFSHCNWRVFYGNQSFHVVLIFQKWSSDRWVIPLLRCSLLSRQSPQKIKRRGGELDLSILWERYSLTWR